MKTQVDWLVVGAGFTGAVVAERLASQRNERVLVVDRRPHLAGNAFDEVDEAGVLVHRYGPHAFHTNSDRVWAYLTGFTGWHPYEHRVRAHVGGHLVPLPFNLDALGALFGRDAPGLERRLRTLYPDADHVPILKLLEAPDAEVRDFARYVYDHVFLGYTLKHWGCPPEALDPSVTGRVPVRLSRDDRYFLDRYQASPAGGFTGMFERLLSHPNVEVRLGCAFEDLGSSVEWKRMVYTGPLDAYFGYAFGPLPYRSLRFTTEHRAGPLVQPVAQVNHPEAGPDAPPHTRTVEYGHMTGQPPPGVTALVREVAEAHAPGANEPYYPIPRADTRALFHRYEHLARALAPRVFFAGRLADYKYYNMDQAVGRALALFDRDLRDL